MDFLKNNAFDTLDITNHEVDVQGWMDTHFVHVFEKSIDHLNRQDKLTIIEVGTWKGLSCITMAEQVKKMGFTNVFIFCVDTWLGAPEFLTWGLQDNTRGKSLECIHGFPSVFYTFTKNVKSLGHHDIIYPFPMSSQQAVEIFKYYNVKADIIYIDAAHEYQAVKDDINAYKLLLKDGGTMMGDDYCEPWTGVIKAVNESFTPTLNGVVWSYTT